MAEYVGKIWIHIMVKIRKKFNLPKLAKMGPLGPLGAPKDIKAGENYFLVLISSSRLIYNQF